MNFDNEVDGSNSIAIGSGINIKHNNCICLGDGLETYEDNQLIIGSKESNISIIMEECEAKIAKNLIEVLFEHVK